MRPIRMSRRLKVSWRAISLESTLTTIVAITQHGVRLALAEEDAADLERDNAASIHDDMTPAMLISTGLDIESQQQVFLFLYL